MNRRLGVFLALRRSQGTIARGSILSRKTPPNTDSAVRVAELSKGSFFVSDTPRYASSLSNRNRWCPRCRPVKGRRLRIVIPFLTEQDRFESIERPIRGSGMTLSHGETVRAAEQDTPLWNEGTPGQDGIHKMDPHQRTYPSIIASHAQPGVLGKGQSAGLMVSLGTFARARSGFLGLWPCCLRQPSPANPLELAAQPCTASHWHTIPKSQTHACEDSWCVTTLPRCYN